MLQNLDLYLFNSIYSWAHNWQALDCFGIFLAKYYQYPLGVFLFSFVFWGASREEKLKNRLMVGLGFGAAIIARLDVTSLIRFLYFRPRPFVSYSEVTPLFNHSVNEASFPSGHASFFFAFAAVVFLFNRKLGVYFLASSFFISLARVFSGVHYPFDIFAGAIIGIVIGYLSYYFFLRYGKNFIYHRQREI